MFNLRAPIGFAGLDEQRPVEFYVRHLPHWRQVGATYFVTFRLADALPQQKIHQLKTMRREWERAHTPPRSEQQWEAYARQVTQKAERWMDDGYGDCHFAQPDFAKLLGDAMLYFQNKRYHVGCYVVMPNHVHVAVRPFSQHELETILRSWKGYVAHEINKALNRGGNMWEQESYDRIIRDEEHLWRVVQYIGRNPAKADLPREQWIRWIDPTWEAAGWRFVDTP